QRGKRIMNLISQYKGLRKENYVLCFGRFVTAMGAMVRPMLTMILSQKFFISQDIPHNTEVIPHNANHHLILCGINGIICVKDTNTYNDWS
ncbi:MAG: hypothetical protein SPJ92_06130, partial [Bariatricus sp.]|nr:hypothetical protein [Bariatricus sp.]